MRPKKNVELTEHLRSFARSDAPFGLYTAGCLRWRRYTKTAEVLLRHRPERIVGIVDDRAGVDRLGELDGWEAHDHVPVAPTTEGLLPERADLVVGVALPGSMPLRAEHRADLVGAADAGHRVFNGLHDVIDHPSVVNLRAIHEEERFLASGAPLRSTRILTVGTGANVGKMTTTAAVRDALAARGCTADWLPTGQTGMLLRGLGRCIDAVPGDFGPGLVEDLVMTLEAQADVIVVEGQGSIFHPVYSPVTVAISHGCRPQYHVLCHRLRDGETGLADRLRQAADRYERLHSALGFRSQLLAVSLDTAAVGEPDAKRAIDEGRRLGVPCVDAVRYGADDIAVAFTALSRPGTS